MNLNLNSSFKYATVLLTVIITVITLSACKYDSNFSNDKITTTVESSPKAEASSPAKQDYNVSIGTNTYKDFTLDNVLHSEKNDDIHFNLYVPKSYDGSKAYALFVTLPGYEGLYFQGVGVNLRQESFGLEAQKYNNEMLIVTPQLNSWDEASAEETIELVKYLLSAYNIDKSKVYIEGYSGGGETASIVVGKRPDLFTAYLQVSSQWDGEYEFVAKTRLPVYIAIGKDDEYYGSKKSQNAYNTLYNLYKKQGLKDDEINKILVLDIKERNYFTSRNVLNEHGGGELFAKDKFIMSWLFDTH